MLLVLCPEVMRKVAKGDTVCEQFIENLKKGIKGGKKSEVATVCYVDICKAATFVSNSEKGNSARIIVASVEKELKERLFNFNQPFKNEEGNIDEALMVDCLVSLFMLNPDKISSTLFNAFVESNNSIFKRVFVKALLSIANEGTSLPWNPTITDIYAMHAGNIRKLFQEFKGSAENYLFSRGVTGKKGEKQMGKATVELDILITLIELYYSAPGLALFPSGGVDATTETRDLLTGLIETLGKFELPELHEVSVRTLLTLNKSEYIQTWDRANPSEGFWIISCFVLRDIATLLIKNNRWQTYEVKKTLQVLHQLLSCKNQFLEANPDMQPSLNSAQLRLHSSTLLETALLIHLPSIELEISSLSAQCFGLMCTEVDQTRAFIKDTENAIVPNFDAYNQLAAAANITTVGREVQQKAIRKVLRQVEHPTNGNYTAWYKLYDRFKLFTQLIIRNIELESEEKERQQKSTHRKKLLTQQQEEKEDLRFQDIPKTLLDKPNDVLTQWNHYINFLCALAAVSKGRKTSSELSSSASGNSSLSSSSKVEVIDEFMQTLVEYLVHESVNFQTFVKNAAGTSLSPAVYPAFFNIISEQISKLKGGANTSSNLSNSLISTSSSISSTSHDSYDTNVLFVDQVILVLRLIIESNSDASHLALLSNIEELVLSMIRFVRQLILTSSTLQTKHKLSGLIEALMQKAAYIPFTNEHKFRSQLVDSIMEWTSEFSSKESAVTDAVDSKVNIKKIIQDLDLQVMQSVSSLLKNLPLQGKDDEAKSEAFSKLFTFFTRLLDRCKREPSTVNPKVPEVTIEALSYLVAANIEHGLDYFKEMGYHENDETRSAFLKVLSNILKQGTEFDMAEEDGVDKYYKLSELIFDRKFEVILTLCEVTPVTEADAIAQLCCRIFEANHCVIDLIKASIVYEVSKTEKANTLFRLNSFATKLMVQYCKLIGVEYLRCSVGPEIRSILANARPMEMDPAKLPAGQDLNENFQNVKSSTERFLNDIGKSIPECPQSFREICAFLRDTVGAKFPGSEHTAIAGFMFLRFLCPAIIAPDGFNVINAPIQDKDSRRSLVLVTKVLQNLANRVLFVKEPFMECMNPFIEENMPLIRSYFDQYSELSDLSPPAQLNFSDEQKEQDFQSLHYYLSQSREKMAKAVQESAAANSTANSTTTENASSWFEKLTSILSQLGEPPQPSTKKATVTRPLPSSGGANVHYEEFMKKMAKVDTDNLKQLHIFYAQGKTKSNIPLLYYIVNRVHVDVEKLFYFMLKTAQPIITNKYSIVIDLTYFNLTNAITPQWIAQMGKILPLQAYDNLENVYIVHPSSSFKKYIKRIIKYIGRATKKVIICSFVSQLYEYIKENDCALPDSTKESELEVQSSFSPVSKNTFGKKTDVEIRITKDSIQIISLRPAQLFNTSGQLIDFIPISSIAQVSPGSKENETILKLESSGKNIQFLSKNASQINQQISDSLERYKLSRPQTKSHKPFQPSDVPGTLLNMALLNLTSTNPSLRAAAYNLLTAACQTFSFNMQSVLIASSEIALARNCMHFVIRISQELSKVEPGLTLEFISEALGGLDDKNIFKLNILQYMKPWLYNLGQFEQGQQSMNSSKIEKIRDCLCSLIAATVRESRDNMPMLLSRIWKPIATLESLLDMVMDCLFQFAVPSNTLDTKKINCVEDIVITLATKKSQLVAGKIINMLIRFIHDPIPNSSNIDRLENHDLWLRIEICLRWLMSLTFENLISLRQFLPEILHIIIMTFGSGDALIRADSYALFINLVHATFTSRTCHKDKIQILKSNLQEFQSTASKIQFGVGVIGKNFDPYQSQEERDNKLEKMNIAMVESIALSLLKLLNCCSTSTGGNSIGTPIHSRWLALTSKAAFTSFPAVQPRAIITLGVLASSPSLVSSDLFKQLLLILKNSLSNSNDKKMDDLTLAVINCLCHLFAYLSPWSKFFKYFFWLAVSLIQLHDQQIFSASLPLLEQVIKTLSDSGHFRDIGLSQFALNSRKSFKNLEPLLDKFDSLSGVNFETNFSFAISTLLLKGLKSPSAKTSTVKTLTTILRLCNEKIGSKMLGYFSALLPMKGDDDVELLGVLKNFSSSQTGDHLICNKILVPDKSTASLLFYFLATVLKNSELEHEQLVIYKIFLEGINYMPDTFPIVYVEFYFYLFFFFLFYLFFIFSFGQIKEKLSQVLANSQNPEILKTIHAINHEIFSRTLTASYSSAAANQTLQNLGYQGLQGSDQFNPKQKGAQIQIVCSILDAMLEE